MIRRKNNIILPILRRDVIRIRHIMQSQEIDYTMTQRKIKLVVINGMVKKFIM